MILMLLIWSVVGMLSTVRVTKEGDRVDFYWSFQRRAERLRTLAAGPVAWLLILAARLW